MRRLTIRGRVSTFTGYGQMFCEIFSGMENRGVFCAVRASGVDEPFGSVVPLEIKSRFVQSVQPEEWELLVHPPTELPTPGKKTAYFTMFESTRLTKESVQLLNMSSRVIVPCKWNEEGFRASGVIVPISVVPLGISPQIFHFAPNRPENSKFTVGIGGRIAHGEKRKSIQRAIDIFGKAFQHVKDVELHVKISPDDSLAPISDNRIHVSKDHLDWSKLRKWFSEIDMFFSLATAEGFGLMQLQSMAMGRPVMAANFGGLAEFMTKENSFCLPFKEVSNPEFGGGLWSEVSDDAAIKSLLYAYTHREEIFKKGVLSAQSASQFTWGDTVENLYQLLNTDGAWD